MKDKLKRKEKRVGRLVDIICCYVSHNLVDATQLVPLMKGIYTALEDMVFKDKVEEKKTSAFQSPAADKRTEPMAAEPVEPAAAEPKQWGQVVAGKLIPAVPIEESITPDQNYIICLEDGKKFKMMKRHLKSSYGMTPNDYRKRWGLPQDYPMVSPGYRALRREVAKRIGLGSPENWGGGVR